MLQCQMCGTTKSKAGNEFTTQGQLNLHEYHCRMKQGGGSQQQTTIEQQGCNHNWRLLNPHRDDERAAMQSHYGEVCTKCQDLR
jgi:hypothetical protein